jgi:hypothetical protein
MVGSSDPYHITFLATAAVQLACAAVLSLCRFDSFHAYAREEPAMLEGICRAGEVLFVPRGVGECMADSSANGCKGSAVADGLVMCCRVVASRCQPGGRCA